MEAVAISTFILSEGNAVISICLYQGITALVIFSGARLLKSKTYCGLAYFKT